MESAIESAIGFYRMVMNNLFDGVCFVDAKRKITFWNDAAEKITGFQRSAVMNQLCSSSLRMHKNAEGGHLCGGDNCPVEKVLRDGITSEETVFIQHKNGYRIAATARFLPITSQKNQIIGAVHIFSEIGSGSEQEKKMKALATLAYFDLVTGLPNRRYVETRMGSLIEEYNKNLSPFGLLLININDFKMMNDKYGPEFGDQVLRSVARSIATSVGPSDIVARWDGTRFLVITPNTKKSLLILLAEKLRQIVNRAAGSGSDAEPLVSVSMAGTINRMEDSPIDLQRRIVVNLQESENKNGAFIIEDE